jgi:hypothetical protein
MFMASGEDFMKKTQQLAWPCWPFFTAILHGPSRAATYRLAWSVSRFAMARKERREQPVPVSKLLFLSAKEQQHDDTHLP